MAFHNPRLKHLQRPVYEADQSSVLGPGMPPPAQAMPTAAQQPQPQRVAANRDPSAQYESLPRPTSFRYDEYQGAFAADALSVAPPALALYHVKEQTVSSPRQLRLTCTHIALEDSRQRALGLPIAVIWHPLADLEPGDDAIPLINHGPFRCTRCNAYINPHFRQVESGRKLQCNICELAQDTPPEYFQDRSSSPELYTGTYDFVAPAEYTVKPLASPLFFFCVETTKLAVDSGILQQVVSSLKNILDYLPVPERTRIGVMTFDSRLTFYKVGESGEPIEVVVSDLNDPFIPDSMEALTFNVVDDRAQLDLLLDRLLGWNFPGISKQTASVGCVVDSVKNYLLKNVGGRLLVFTAQLGTLGKFKLANRNDPKAYNTEKEKLMMQPAAEYLTLGQECNANDICVDVFACNTHYIDAASIAALCTQSGGDFYMYTGYSNAQDGERLYYQMVRILTRQQGTQAIMRARVSNGLSIENYVGKFKRRGPVEMEAAAIDADKTLTIVLKYDEKLVENKDYYVQCAMLYTTQNGMRVIRVSNTVLRATRMIEHVFKQADAEAIANVYLKIHASNVYDMTLQQIREGWHQHMINMLKTHRVTLQEPADPTILVLPEKLRQLPLFSSSSMKLPAFSLHGVQIDSRMYSIHALITMPLIQSRLLLYPSIYSLHDLESQVHGPGLVENELVRLPKLVACSGRSLSSEGVYLIANGEVLILYVGRSVNDEVIREIWGLVDAEDLKNSPEYWGFQDINTEMSSRVFAIVEELKRRNPGPYPVCLFLFEGDDIIKRFLVEDPTPSEMSYGDYLKKIHTVVMNRISNN